jgi:hypothetical protein
MKIQHEPKLIPRMRQAVTELENRVREQYPNAGFHVRRSTENPRIIHLMTTVDVEDRDEVMDVVIDRMMELQIEEKLPLFVIPVRPRARTLAMLREQAGTQQHSASTPLNP